MFSDINVANSDLREESVKLASGTNRKNYFCFKFKDSSCLVWATFCSHEQSSVNLCNQL